MSSSLTTPSVLDGERNRSKNWISVSQENVCWLVCHSVKSDVGSAGGVQQGGGQDDGDGGEWGGRGGVVEARTKQMAALKDPVILKSTPSGTGV